LTANSINRYRARGIRYAAIFDFTTLSRDIAENQIIKAALQDVIAWLRHNGARADPNKLSQALALLQRFREISEIKSPAWRATVNVPKIVRFVPPHMRYYAEALWSAYAIMQRLIPDVAHEGYVSLDSMIVDVSAVFEGYVRAVLADSLGERGFVVKDGNLHPRPFFSNDSIYEVKPDIIIEQAGLVRAVFDAKYKPKVSEQDRYELLSFMEAVGAKHAAFICPRSGDAAPSQFLGTTLEGKNIGIIRVDIASADAASEEKKLVSAALKVLAGRYDFQG
jgi:5-methylcytosine-specific restriction endonuclease McrBC regulatory subunit McrC